MSARLALGTAQFDGVYGRNGTQVAPSDLARELLSTAEELGIDMIDTAAGYGRGETLIGDHDWTGRPPAIVTKSPHPKPGTELGEDFFLAAARDSLVRLRRDRLYGFLCHSPSLFTADPASARTAADGLHRIRSEGLASRIGVSVYTAEDVAAVLDVMRPDIIQLPISLADQRLLHDGTLDRLRDAGVEVHARSLFLRGALLKHPDSLPAHLSPVGEVLRRIDGSDRPDPARRLAACLGFVKSVPGVTRLVVGAEDGAQLADQAGALAAPTPNLDWDALAISDPHVVNPGLWPQDSLVKQQ